MPILFAYESEGKRVTTCVPCESIVRETSDIVDGANAVYWEDWRQWFCDLCGVSAYCDDCVDGEICETCGAYKETPEERAQFYVGLNRTRKSLGLEEIDW